MFLYQVINETLYHVDIGSYISYGLRVIFLSYGIYKEVQKISDISTDEKKVALLAELCTKNQLSPIHLLDVIEDFLELND